MDCHEAATLKTRQVRFHLVAMLVSLAAASATAQVTVTEGTNLTVDVTADGRLAIDLLGSIWVLPAKGGNAEPVATGTTSVTRPRWSPGSEAILFEARAEGRSNLGIYRFASDVVQSFGDERYSERRNENRETKVSDVRVQRGASGKRFVYT